MKFRSDVAGFVTGIRFYKYALNTGTHVGNLWSSTGTRLATATFTGETRVGLAAGDLRVAGGDRGEHGLRRVVPLPQRALQRDARTTSRRRAWTRPPLHALANGVSGGNGVFAYGATSTFPTEHVRARQLLGGRGVQHATAPTLTSIAVTPGEPDGDGGRDAAVHGHGHVLGREHAEPDEPGDVGVVEHRRWRR